MGLLREYEKRKCSALPGGIREGFLGKVMSELDLKRSEREATAWRTCSDQCFSVFQCGHRKGFKPGKLRRDCGRLERGGGQILMTLVGNSESDW